MLLRSIRLIGSSAPCRRASMVASRASTQGAPPRPDPPRQTPGLGATRPPPGRPQPGVMLGPDGTPLEVVPVEKTGSDAWAGVAAVDDGKDTNWGKVGQLVAGDAAAFLVFAVIGRINHGEVLDWETLATALPFMIGWFSTAPFLGGYGPEAQGGKVGPAALAAAKCWAVGIPLGLVVRGVTRGYVPPTPFIIVSLAATAVLLGGWRSALAAATKEGPPPTGAAALAARRDKQGNPLEFFQLLISLTKRW